MLIRTLLGLGALALAAATVASCSEPVACNSAGCFDALQARGEVPTLSTERAHLQVQACRNGQCSSGEIDSDAMAGEDWLSVELSGDAGVNLWLRQREPYWELSLNFEQGGAAGPYQDGDVVSVQVIDLETNTTLDDMEESITYGVFAPNGEACGPICKSGQVELSMF